MKNLRDKFCLMIGLMLTLNACKKDEVSSFSASSAINFTVSADEYSFMVNPNNEYLKEIDVKIIGDTSAKDRTFTAVAVKDATTTATDVQYEIIGGTVKAGKYVGKLIIKLKNSAVLSTSKVVLKVKLVDSPDFKAGNKESSEYTIGWTNQILLPAVWTYYNVFFAAKSTKVYEIILKSTGQVTLTRQEYAAMGEAGAIVLGTKFGDYVKQYNLDHPTDHLKHNDGSLAGTDIIPKYYTKTKYN